MFVLYILYVYAKKKKTNRGVDENVYLTIVRVLSKFWRHTRRRHKYTPAKIKFARRNAGLANISHAELSRAPKFFGVRIELYMQEENNFNEFYRRRVIKFTW